MCYVIKQNVTASLIPAEVPGVNFSKSGIYALLLRLLLNLNDTSSDQSRHLVGPTETQLMTHENRRLSVTRCAGRCSARDCTQ